MADKTHELPVLEDVWRGLVVEGRVMTVDAWLTPRTVAVHMVHDGGDYVMRVKGNPPQLQHDMQLVCQEAHASAATMAMAATVDSGHGRLEPRRLTACRNTAIGLRPWAGETNIAATCRRLAAQPWAALALIGIRPDN